MSRSSKPRATTPRRKKQHIKIVEDSPEFAFDAPISRDAISQDLQGQAELALQQIEEMKQKQLELARHREELEEINLQKQEFLAGQGDLVDKFTGAISLIEREVFEMKQEIDDLQRTRDTFALHLEKMEALDYRSWKREELAARLDNALVILDRAEDDYVAASDHFEGARAQVFRSGRRRRAIAKVQPRAAGNPLAEGLLFHAPVIALALLGILVYFVL